MAEEIVIPEVIGPEELASMQGQMGEIATSMQKPLTDLALILVALKAPSCRIDCLDADGILIGHWDFKPDIAVTLGRAVVKDEDDHD